MSGRAPANVLPHYVPDDTPVVYADDAPDEDGLVDAGTGFALVVAWVPDERGGRLVAAAESGFRGWRARPSADVDALAQVARARVEAALDLGRYLLVAGSRRATQPLTLQGIWNADVRPAWSSNLTTNINTWRFTDPVPGLPQWVNWASALWWLTDHAVQHHAYRPPGDGQERLRRRVSVPAGETVKMVAP